MEINNMEINYLGLFFIVNLLTILILVFCVDWRLAKWLSLNGAFLQLSTFLGMYAQFSYADAHKPQFSIYLTFAEPYLPIHLGVDGLSIWFVFLTLFLLPVCILSGWESIKHRVVEFQLIMHVITFMLMIVFTTQNLLLFYITFESVLIPMFVIIGVWGSRERKIHATYQFFLFTLVGSVAMLVAIIYIFITCGSVDLNLIKKHNYTTLESTFLWICIFIAFAVKVPMFPVHIWLPEAHVEAPTPGSVLLAGILLKMGGYGYIKFLLPIFSADVIATLQVYVFTIALLGIAYSTVTTVRQVDLKKIIAYSSVSHMNYVMIGIVSGDLAGIEGAVLTMIGHGFVSSALFILVGALYERHATRVLHYYGGLGQVIPGFSVYLFLFTLANVALPGTSNFVGELLIFVGIYPVSGSIAFSLAFMTVFSAVYAFWLYNRLVFGRMKDDALTIYADLNKREKLLVLVFMYYVLLMGLCPSLFLDAIHAYFVGGLGK
jgi:proton-translocating NADH-quinone oxidoreductase chain M